MTKVLAPCPMCNTPTWFKVDKKTGKAEDKPCQRCRNFISQIQQRVLANKKKANMITEYSIKEEVKDLIKLEKQHPKELKRLRNGKAVR